MRMSQEGEWKTKKVSEKNRSYTASATAKRFSSTIEYTDHVYCPYQNQGNAKFTLPINALSINIYSRAIPIYVVSIVSIYLHRVGSLTRHQPDYELLSHLDSERACRRCRAHIIVPQQFLDRSDIIPVLQQMGRERMT
jgi:hypothetical protein